MLTQEKKNEICDADLLKYIFLIHCCKCKRMP